MKNIEKAFAIGLALCVAASAWQLPFSRSCKEIREDTLRLHIIANSDSEEDQTVKLAVRDAILDNSPSLLLGASNRDEAVELIGSRTRDIESISAEVLKENGFCYGVKAYITTMYFEQRSYDNVTLPAGYYAALRIELGAAEGHNWWCVVYPSLCIPSASEEDPMDGYTEDEQDILSGDQGYEYKFKLEEWLQSLLSSY